MATPEESEVFRIKSIEDDARLAAANAVISAHHSSYCHDSTRLKSVRANEPEISCIFVQHTPSEAAPDSVTVHFTLKHDVVDNDVVSKPPACVQSSLARTDVIRGSTIEEVVMGQLSHAVVGDDRMRMFDESRLPFYCWLGVVIRHKESFASGDEWRTNTASIAVFAESPSLDAARLVSVQAAPARSLRYATRLSAFASMIMR